MLKAAIQDALNSAGNSGWILEPDAKRLLRAAGMRVPVFKVCQKADNAVSWAKEIGYPVAAKVVSPNAMHKSEVKGVVVGIGDDDALGGAYQHFRRIDGFCGMLVEKMIAGVEVIIGAKIDYQFGPIILMGIGGTAVEIYQDAGSTIRASAMTQSSAEHMTGLRSMDSKRSPKAMTSSEKASTVSTKASIFTASEPR